MTITKAQFEAAVPSAVMPDDELFDRISQYIGDADRQLSTLVGDTLHSLIEEADTSVAYLATSYVKAVCLTAYRDTIPHLDIVLTPTGFGVVNNQNVAPASKERIERLMATVQDGLDDATEDIICLCRTLEQWPDEIATRFFRSIFWHSKNLMYLGLPNSHRSKLTELRPRIEAAEVKLIHRISPEFHNELCDALRHKSTDDYQDAALHYMRATIAADAQGHGRMAHAHFSQLMEYLHDNLDKFPTYAASTAYEANIFTPYQNTRDDTTFFFG